MVVVVAQRLRGGHHDALAGMDAQRVEVFHVADGDAVVKAVAHHLVFDFFPAAQRFLDEHLGRECESFLHQGVELLGIVAESRAEAAQGVGCAHDDRVSQLLGDSQRRCLVGGGAAADGLDVDLVEFLDKELAVFSVDDGAHGGAEHLHAVALEHSRAEELHAAVEGGLAAEGEQDAVGALLGDDALDKGGRHGQEVYLVGKSLGGLHGGDVGVDEHSLEPLLLHGLERLGAGVVKLAGLADFQRSAAQKQHLVYGCVLVHVSGL